MTKYFAQCRAEEGTREENISTFLYKNYDFSCMDVGHYLKEVGGIRTSL